MEVAYPNTLAPSLANFLSALAVITIVLWFLVLLRRYYEIRELMRISDKRIMKIPMVGFSLRAVQHFARDHLIHALLRAGCDKMSNMDVLNLPFSAALSSPNTLSLTALDPPSEISNPIASSDMTTIQGTPPAASPVAAGALMPLKFKLQLHASTCMQVFWGVSEEEVQALQLGGTLGVRQLQARQGAPPAALLKAFKMEEKVFFRGTQTAAEVKSGVRIVNHSVPIPLDCLQHATDALEACEDQLTGSILCVAVFLQVEEDAADGSSSDRGGDEEKVGEWSGRGLPSKPSQQYGDIHAFAVVVRMMVEPVAQEGDEEEDAEIDGDNVYGPGEERGGDGRGELRGGEESGEERRGEGTDDMETTANPMLVDTVLIKGESIAVLPHRSYSYGDVFGGADGSSAADETNDCVVCMSEPASVILMPCRHFSICGECVQHLTQCPVCRTTFHARAVLSSDLPKAAPLITPTATTTTVVTVETP